MQKAAIVSSSAVLYTASVVFFGLHLRLNPREAEGQKLHLQCVCEGGLHPVAKAQGPDL
jgi:hypothetical protein